ncbi:hypothetical protein Q31b_25030 [Novipirellula aureliae]|uniref:Uncharacterized protein n=1 Tax=Novipirellula aureliae TaxID=2527966 RepID=A0A5C6E3J4_9BACT|nr:hypothetical protein Q31b_25030 [Novipirellula aureliae]
MCEPKQRISEVHTLKINTKLRAKRGGVNSKFKHGPGFSGLTRARSIGSLAARALDKQA